jgi:OLD-like protein
MIRSRQPASEAVAFGPRPPLVPATARECVLNSHASAAILVEGWSDQAAIEALARRRGWDLRTEGILTLPIGGVTNLGAFIQELGASGLGLGLAGLCDAAEEDYARRTLERAGMGEDLHRTRLEAMGFFICEADLEDELIRALGATAVEAVLDAQGELTSFRRFQEQPAQRGRGLNAQLRRFMGTRARRKVRYGSLLMDAIHLAHVPRALELVIAHARASAILCRGRGTRAA